MTKDDIIRMALEAKLSNDFGNLGYPYFPELEHFANLVAAAEREACAVICENYHDYFNSDVNYHSTLIRARGQ